MWCIGDVPDVQGRPCLQVAHVRFDERRACQNHLEVPDADLAVAERGDADAGPRQFTDVIGARDLLRFHAEMFLQDRSHALAMTAYRSSTVADPQAARDVQVARS